MNRVARAHKHRQLLKKQKEAREWKRQEQIRKNPRPISKEMQGIGEFPIPIDQRRM